MKDFREFIKTTLIRFLNENHNSHLIEVKPNRYVYHSSSPFVRDIISKEGLIPQGKSAAWLSDTKIDGKVIFVVNSDDKDDWWDSTYDDDLYKIDTTKIKNNKWFNDPNFDLEDKRVITFEPIPTRAIKLIYKGSGESDVTPGWMRSPLKEKNITTDIIPYIEQTFYDLIKKYGDKFDLKGYTLSAFEFDEYHEYCPYGFDMDVDIKNKRIRIDFCSQNDGYNMSGFQETLYDEIESILLGTVDFGGRIPFVKKTKDDEIINVK